VATRTALGNAWPATSRDSAIGAGLEAGSRGSRTERRASHAGPPKLFGQAQRERQHEGLRRVVGRHQRPWLKRRGGGQVQDPSGPPLEHARDDPTGQLGQRHHVDREHLGLPRGIILGERPVHREASVVDERLGDDVAVLELIDDGVCRSRGRQVRGDHVRRHTMSLSQLAGEPGEPRAVACHEDDVATVGGE
jgi:hypothetical protein